MGNSYSAAETAWIEANYHTGTVADTVDAFEREFGRRPTAHALQVKAHRMGLKKDTHGEERHQRAQKTMRWSSPGLAREREWMLEHDNDESVFAVIDAFEAEFGIRLTRSQVSLFRALHGGKKRASHGGGKPSKPVGSERLGKDGYIMVKVREWPTKPQSKDNWRFKHHVVWEEANGQPVPPSTMIVFADHDKRNFAPDNLMAVPRSLWSIISREHWSYRDRESLEACVNLAKLGRAVYALKCHPRDCKACGEEFAPRFPNQRTCDACLAKRRAEC